MRTPCARRPRCRRRSWGFAIEGLVREGFQADLVVIDLTKLADKATFFEPHQYSEGVDHVLVNGRSVVTNGRPTGELAGEVLRPERLP